MNIVKDSTKSILWKTVQLTSTLSFLGHKHRHKVKRQTNSYENYLATAAQNDQYNNYASPGSDGIDESQPGWFIFSSMQ